MNFKKIMGILGQYFFLMLFLCLLVAIVLAAKFLRG